MTTIQDLRAPALALCALLAAPAAADPPAPTYDRVHLSVSVSAEVATDTLVVTLYSEHQAERQAQAAGKVNADVRFALDRARVEQAVEAETTSYRAHPVYRNQTLVGWRVRQSLRLESEDAGALSELLGDVQERLATESVHYEVTDAARAEVEDRLIGEAVDAFGARARIVADRLARSGYRIVELNVSSHGVAPPMPMRAMAMADEAALARGGPPPALEGGTQQVTVTASGTVELQL